MKKPQTPLDAYIHHYGFIRQKLERLQELADRHFGHDPNAIHWAEVSQLDRANKVLDEALAIFTSEQYLPTIITARYLT
jgi:hypothetical protein